MFCPRCRQQFSGARAFCTVDGERLIPDVSFSAYKPTKTGRVGAVLGGRYRVRGFVSKGATARVYLAEDMLSGQPVAVKMMDQGLAQDPKLVARFLREAKATMAIDHPNVIKILNVGQSTPTLPYLVMEILLGETLGEFLRREGTMPSDLALTFARQAAGGLAAAHRAGVIHRDIKPDNLFLLGDRGEPYGLKVLDFGLAKRTQGSKFSAGGLVLGTIEYMSPEQLLSDPVDARTDVYGLGVVMFRMFTGQLPFDVKANFGMLAHQLLSPAPPPSWLNDAMDPRIERIMLTAMRKHPENRYPTMEDLLVDMEIILGMSPGQPSARPLEHDPDRYEPQTPRAREAAAVLTKNWG